MIAALTSSSSDPPGHRSRQLLLQIADALGVGIDAFRENPARHLIHTAADGTLWFLVSGADGRPVVRRVGPGTGCPGITDEPVDEPVDEFFARDRHTPQAKALAAIVDQLLLTSLL